MGIRRCSACGPILASRRAAPRAFSAGWTESALRARTSAHGHSIDRQGAVATRRRDPGLRRPDRRAAGMAAELAAVLPWPGGFGLAAGAAPGPERGLLRLYLRLDRSVFPA